MGKKKCSPVILINKTIKCTPNRELVVCSTGPIGILGYTGTIGLTGSKGSTGFTGIQGEIGATAMIGLTGQMGVLGQTGEIGFCCTGTTGEVGLTGMRGISSGTGFTGQRGEIGSCCENMTGPTGASGSNVMSSNCTGCTGPIYVGNTVFVDAVYGSSTGQRERFDLPFQTLYEAYIAAQLGDLIIVRPGTYDPSSSVSKDGVNWYFEEGAIVNNPTMMIFGSGTYDITGYGYLYVQMTRDNGILTANYVNSLTVSGGIVTMDVKVMNMINVTGGILQGTVNELTSTNSSGVLFSNSGGTVQLTIDDITYLSTTTTPVNNGLITSSSETELLVGNINISAGSRIVITIFSITDGDFNLIFDQLVTSMTSSNLRDIFDISGGNVNVKGNLILVTYPTWTYNVFNIIASSIVNVDIDVIQVTSGTIFNSTTGTSASVKIRGNSHIGMVSPDILPSIYLYNLTSASTVFIDVKDIILTGFFGIPTGVIFISSGEVYISAQSISTSSYLYIIAGGKLYSRVQTAVSSSALARAAILSISSIGPAELVLSGGYQSTQQIPVIYDTSEGYTTTIILRGVTLQTASTSTIETNSLTPVIIQNQGAVTGNKGVGANVTFLFNSASSSFNGYNVDPNVTI